MKGLFLVGKIKIISDWLIRSQQRFIALFLVEIMTLSIISTPALALSKPTGQNDTQVINSARNNKNLHKTSTEPSAGKINYNSPPAPTTLISKTNSADNATSTPSSSADSVLGAITGKVNDEKLSSGMNTGER